MLVRLLPVFISSIFLGAHFFRASNYTLTAFALISPLLLLIHRRWAVLVVQALLIAGSLVWLETIINLIRIRQAHEQPWVRMAVILMGVVLFTAGSALVFRLRSIKELYSKTDKYEKPGMAAFLLTAALLTIVQVKVELPLLLMERFFPGSGWVEIFLLSLYARFVTVKMLDPLQSARWRIRVWSLFSIVFFSQLALGLAGFDRFLMTGKLHLPVPAMIIAGPLYRAQRFFMPVLFIVTVILAGSAWCSYLCYLGAWDAGAAARRKKPKILPEWRKSARLAILVFVAGLSILLRVLGASVLLATSLGLGFGVLGVGIMIFWSRKAGVMTHCTTYCPVGILANWLGRLSPFRVRIKNECTECRVCSLVCRYEALKIEDIRRRRPGSSCTLCGDCIGSCREKWIEYRFFNFQPERARAWFVVIVVVLHSVFLAVARI